MNGPKRLATSGQCSVWGCHGPTLPNGAPRGGFTLVELLVVITIIGLLAGLAMGALVSARESARAFKTKSTIAKLDILVQQHYDSYRTRRVTIYDSAGTRLNPSSLGSPLAAASLRLQAIRDLMRMEMPDRWTDVTDGPAVLTIPAGTFQVNRPSLSGSYLRKRSATSYLLPPDVDSYDSAECLYLWVTRAIPDAREKFAENEIGDADGDTLAEFVDGWGNPIKFIRWAPAFTDSDVQQYVFWDPDLANPDEDNRILRLAASEADHDPFDSRKLDIDSDPTDATKPPRGGWRLVPLIYSAGPDGIYGLDLAGSYSYANNDPNPYYYDVAGTSTPSNIGGGLKINITAPNTSKNVSLTGPKEVNIEKVTCVNIADYYTSFDYLDNIHNHRAEGN